MAKVIKMSVISESDVIRAIFEHSNSANERSIARQIDGASGVDRRRLINENRSIWSHYEQIAKENNRKNDKYHSDIVARVDKRLQIMGIDDLKNFAQKGNDLAIEELKRRGN